MRTAENSRFTNPRRLAPVVAFLALSLASCGSSEDSGVDLFGTALSPGGVVGDFNTYCAQRGGLVIYGGTSPVCKISRYFSIADFGAFPVLTPSSQSNAAPIGYQASQIYARPGDRLIVQGGSGGWGSLQTDSYLGGFFNLYSWDCDAIPLSGSGHSNNEGLKPGLVGSVGGNPPFLIGANLNKVFDQEGYFKFGFNVPSGYSTSLCFQVSFSRFEFQHCENTSGATISCP
ncbi:MAG: hypothetical protein IT285_00075 [Bdellovibrionales bacterium]|nr:hypothetical protein [Bdellovibrionales bacterium]